MDFSRKAGALAIAICCAGGAFAAQKDATPAANPAANVSPAAATPAPAAATATSGYGVKLGGYFNDSHEQAAKRYFAQAAKGKTCPEGLQRTGKACKPPVEGRYWAVGQSLQKAVTTYPLPEQLATQLPPAPAGYEYLRAGADVLLVSKGIHLVVDILEDVTG